MEGARVGGCSIRFFKCGHTDPTNKGTEGTVTAAQTYPWANRVKAGVGVGEKKRCPSAWCETRLPDSKTCGSAMVP